MQIPRRTGRAVQTEALPGARANVNAPAGAFGQTATLDISPLQHLAEQVHEQEFQKANNTALIAADNELDALEGGARIAAQQRKGRDAMGALSEARATWDEGSAKVEASLTNDAQRAAFQQRRAARWQSLRGAVESHAAREAEAYRAETYGTALQARVSAAIDNPATAGLQVGEVRALVATYGKGEGWGQDVLDQKTAAAVSAVHAAAITSLVSKRQDLAAKAYFDAHADELHGQDKVSAQAAVEHGSLLGETQRKTAEIMAIPGITEADAHQRALGIADPELQKEVVQSLKVEFNYREQLRNSAWDTADEAGYDYLLKTGSLNPALLARMRPRSALALKQYARTLAKGDEPTTDWKVYQDLKLMAADPATRRDFASTDLMQYRNRLGDTEFKELVAFKAAIAEGRKDPALDGFLGVSQIVQNSLLRNAPEYTKKNLSNQQKQRLAVLTKMVNDRVTDYQQATGKTVVPHEEVQRITDELLLEQPSGGFTIPSFVLPTPVGTFGFGGGGRIGGSQRRLFEQLANTDPNDVRSILDVPPAMQERIRSSLLRAKKPATAQSILVVYKDLLTATQGGAAIDPAQGGP